MKKLKSALSILLVIAVFLLSPPLRKYESLAAMTVYSEINRKESLLERENIEISLPTGEGWFPLMMTFCADGAFSSYIGQSAELAILYTFADFSPVTGASRIYEEASPLYSSFFGAYAVKTKSPFGFKKEDGGYKLDVTKTAVVPEFDYKRLVLSDFGLSAKDMVFDWNVLKLKEDVSYMGIDGFTCVDAELTVNGCNHHAQGFKQSYVQYGAPYYAEREPFKPVNMYGRVYGKYFEEKDVSIFMYVITADAEALNRCDKELLSQSKIVFK